MYRKLTKKILYAPLLTSLMIVSVNAAQSQENSSDYMNKINELEARISQLEVLKQELQALKLSLKAKEQKMVVKEEKLDTALKSIDSIQKVTSVREASPDSKWQVTGYASATFEAINGDNVDSFGAGSYSPIFHYKFKDWIMFEAELEGVTEDNGETAIDLEYSQINLMLNDNVTLVMGKFLSPIGQFQERLHPAWINKSIDRPAGLSHEGVAPGSDIGLMVRGGVPFNDFTLSYAAFVGNGPRFDSQEVIALEGFGADNDKNKSLGGRVSLLHKSSVEVGFSYMTASLSSPEMVNDDSSIELARKSDYRLWGADAAYTEGPWDLRFEYMHSRATPVMGADMRERTWNAWYGQAAYRLSDITDNSILGKFEPVVRYGEYRVKIAGSLMDVSEKRWNVGINYWLAPSIVLKAHVERRDFITASEPNETRYQLQFAYGY